MSSEIYISMSNYNSKCLKKHRHLRYHSLYTGLEEGTVHYHIIINGSLMLQEQQYSFEYPFLHLTISRYNQTENLQARKCNNAEFLNTNISLPKISKRSAKFLSMLYSIFNKHMSTRYNQT